MQNHIKLIPVLLNVKLIIRIINKDLKLKYICTLMFQFELVTSFVQ